jgi:hypothetical protein
LDQLRASVPKNLARRNALSVMIERLCLNG